MRILVMYDLPFNDYEQTKEYTSFRKELLRQGFYKMQFSIYCKVILTKPCMETFLRRIKLFLPHGGEIRVLLITEKQFEDMLFLRGNKSKEELLVGDNKIVFFDGVYDE